ncbi:MAG: polyprenyl synthetase family protein [Candidatus Nanohalobium sp.]
MSQSKSQELKDFSVDEDSVKARIVEEVPFQQVNDILEGKLERKEVDRRKVVEDVEEYDNKVISGGGKRFRVAVPYLMAKGLETGFEDSQIIESVTPVEMLHGLSLILDDVMDEDEMRRGMQTPHERLKEQGFTGKQAESIATLDVMQLQSMAQNTPFDMDYLSESQQIEVSEALNDALIQLTRGQMLDVTGEEASDERFREKLSYEGEEFQYESFYDDVVRGKTTPLFRAGPEILEIITGEDLSGLKNYAEDMGKAFQIRDDVLDISAGEEEISISESPEEEGIGKDRYSDISEGTLTLPINYAFEMMDDEGWGEMDDYIEELAALDNFLGSREDFYRIHGDRRNFLETVMEKEEPESYELQVAGKIIEDTGALERANQEALDYAESAVKNLDESEVSREYEELLGDMAYFAATRSK